MKELIELPEKWKLCVKNLKLEDIEPYLLKKYGKIHNWIKEGYPFDLRSYFLLSEDKSDLYTPKYFSRGADLEKYTEITFEQFKKWVMKESFKFEAGKWYEITNNADIYIIKPTIVEENFLRTCDYICGNKNFYKGGGFGIHEIESARELKTEDKIIQKCLPENHPDKIKQPIKTKETMEKPKTFGIKGSKALLEAMWKEMQKLGYTGTIGTYYNSLYPLDGESKRSLERFKNYHDYCEINVDVTFSLPLEYNEALAFAKEMLEDKYWKKVPEFKEDTWYKMVEEDHGKYYVKNKFKNQGLDSFTKFICNGHYYTRNIHLGNEGTYTYKEVDSSISDIQNALPEGHIDKIKPKEWADGTYAVCLRKGVNASENNVGDIYHIKDHHWADNITRGRKGYSFNCKNGQYKGVFKWFATLSEAQEFAETLKEEKKILPFGVNTFTIDKENNVAICSEGKIDKADIEAFVEYIDGIEEFEFLGHTCEILTDSNIQLKFGCYEGTFSEIVDILNAFDE